MGQAGYPLGPPAPRLPCFQASGVAPLKTPLDISARQLYSVYKQYTVSDGTQIRIDLDASTPVNRQIVDQIRTLLVEGVLPPGADLPSVRRLATDLGVHFATVADAYRTLAEEGWLEISHGRSARVLPRRAPAADREADDLFRRRLRQLVAEARSQGVTAKKIAIELASLAKGMAP